MIRLAAAGWEVHIATVANGDCGTPKLTRAEIAAIRRREGESAAAKIGATYHCLDEPDVHVVCDKPTISKVIDLLRGVAPTLLFTHPRHDYMLDHEQVHLLARAGAFSYPIPNATTLPLIDGSAIPWLYYCDPVEGTDPYTGESGHADDLRGCDGRARSQRAKCSRAMLRSVNGCEPTTAWMSTSSR